MTRGEAAGALFLVAALGWTAWDVARIGTDERRPLAAAAQGPRPGAPLAENAYADIVSRSLFVPSRQADFASARDNPAAVSGHVLRGVMRGARGGVALFEPLGGGPALRLRAGSSIGGYRIVAVEADAVLLERDGISRRIDIDLGPPPLGLAEAGMDRMAPESGPLPQGDALPRITSQTDDEIEQ